MNTNTFIVRFIRSGLVERQIEAQATDSIQCAIDHIDSANGAKVDVMPVDVWDRYCLSAHQRSIDQRAAMRGF